MAISPDLSTGAGGPTRRPVLSAAGEALAGLQESAKERLWALSEAELTETLATLGAVAMSVDAHLVAVIAEAGSRGLGLGDGTNLLDWAGAQAPGLSLRRRLEVHDVARAAAEPRLADVVAAVAQGAGTAAEREEALPVDKAAQLVRFHAGVRGMADPEQLEQCTATLLEGARGRHGLSDRQLAVAVRHTANLLKPDRLVEDQADLRRRHRSLFKSRGPLGMTRYTLLLDEEGAAVLDTAVDALARPAPDAETGEPDPRPAATRRADALLELVRRAVGAPEGVPRQAKTALVLSIGLDVLQGRCRGAGLTMTGELLTVDTVRKLACDAEIIPLVFGTDGEVLEQGTAKRLFTGAQIRHLWLRDQGCTFPDCTKPATWCDAHHLIHWADDGPTDTTNAALLCQAHHTAVHRHRYAGNVVAGPHGPRVRWDLNAGSYDLALSTHRRSGTNGDHSTGRSSGPESRSTADDGVSDSDGGRGWDVGPPRP